MALLCSRGEIPNHGQGYNEEEISRNGEERDQN